MIKPNNEYQPGISLRIHLHTAFYFVLISVSEPGDPNSLDVIAPGLQNNLG